MRRRRNKSTGSAKIAAAARVGTGGPKSRARRRPALPPYETVMGIGVQLAVAAMISELAERVSHVVLAAREVAKAAELGETLQEAAGGIAAGLVEEWAGEVQRVVEGGRPDWHPQTIAWWADVWHSPMADHWLDVDKHALTRLAVLVEMFVRGPTQQLLAEIRLQEQRFGLTWADRQRLGWKAPPAPTKNTPKEDAPTETPADPRQLRIVKAETA